MIEKIIKNYLTEKGVTAYLVKPTGVTTYCLIKKSGGGRENFLRSARVIIQSYSDTLQGAAELNEHIINLLCGDGVNISGIAAETEVSSCDLNSDYEYNDKTRGEYRYQALFDLYY